MRFCPVALNTSSGTLQYRKVFSGAVLTTLAQGSKIVVGFSILKLIALYLGPEGLGKLGHFMSLTSILALLAGGGISHGVIKYSAEYKHKVFKLYKLLSTSSFFSLIFTCVFALIFLTFSRSISKQIFGSEEMSWVISLLAIFQVMLAFNMLFSSFANGLADVRAFAYSQIVGNIIALPISWFMIYKFGITGAAIAILSVLGMASFPSLIIYLKSSLRFRFKLKKINPHLLKELSWFSLMLCVSAIAFPVVEIFIRQGLIDDAGYTQAGIWQGAIRLSSAYLGFFSVFLASVFMPMISGINDKRAIDKLTTKFIILVMVVFSIGGSSLYLGRSFFVPLLLSREFDSLQDFLLYQIVGDFFKAANYVIGFVAVARAATRVYILSEIVQASLFVLLSIMVGRLIGGAEGVTVAYMISNIVCFSVGFILFKIWARN